MTTGNMCFFRWLEQIEDKQAEEAMDEKRRVWSSIRE